MLSPSVTVGVQHNAGTHRRGIAWEADVVARVGLARGGSAAPTDDTSECCRGCCGVGLPVGGVFVDGGADPVHAVPGARSGVCAGISDTFGSSYSAGVSAGGSHGPVVKSSVRAW